MPSEGKRPQLPVFFYRTQTGTEPVRAWLQAFTRNRSSDNRDRSSARPEPMARRHATLPIARSRSLGIAVQSREQPHSTRAVFRPWRPHRCRPWFHQEDACHARGHSGLGAQTNAGDATMKKKNPHWGSSLDDFLKEEGIYDEVVSQVEKEVIAWQLQQAMKKKKITKKRMAELMKTSRTQVDKLLNPKDGNVTIKTLHKAAAVVGKRFEYKLV